MKIINVMSNHLKIGLSCNQYKYKSIHKSFTSYNTTCYGHNFDRNSQIYNFIQNSMVYTNNILFVSGKKGSSDINLKKNDEIKIELNIPVGEMKFWKNNSLINNIKNVILNTNEKYHLVLSLGDPNMKIRLVDSTRVPI